MEKEFIPYEESLALKELGFDEYCLASYYYFLDGNGIQFQLGYIEDGPKNYTLAPLYQQAFKWYRKKYNFSYDIVKGMGFEGVVRDWGNGDILWHDGTYNSYEEAELACLKKLIEIVKNK